MDCKNLKTIYFAGRLPDNIYRALIPTNCTIYVPGEYIQNYRDAFGADYKYIYAWYPDESSDGDKCATPSVVYESGELRFACETPGAKFLYTISDMDMATKALSEDGKISLSAAYNISLRAIADGYKPSDKAEAMLYWAEANLEDATNINQTKTRGIVASVNDGIVSISGLYNGEMVKFFAADGKYIGSAVAANGTTSYAVSESLVIAKVGNNSIKISMK